MRNIWFLSLLVLPKWESFRKVSLFFNLWMIKLTIFKLSKAKFSHFDRTRGDRKQIFCILILLHKCTHWLLCQSMSRGLFSKGIKNHKIFAWDSHFLIMFLISCANYIRLANVLKLHFQSIFRLWFNFLKIMNPFPIFRAKYKKSLVHIGLLVDSDIIYFYIFIPHP